MPCYNIAQFLCYKNGTCPHEFCMIIATKTLAFKTNSLFIPNTKIHSHTTL